MAKHIVIIQGHPDPGRGHFGHALAEAYADGARRGGHHITEIEIAQLEFPLLRSKEDFEQREPPDVIRAVQATIARADHLVIFYPLWLGAMPAVVKGFFEQVFRPAFVTGTKSLVSTPVRKLKGKSARVVVTMGMPAFIYRWYFGAHSLKNLQRNILGFCGIKPVKESLIGSVEATDGRRREKWLARLETLGGDGK